MNQISRFFVALEDARVPMEEYLRALGSRGDKLERDVSRLEADLDPSAASKTEDTETGLRDRVRFIQKALGKSAARSD